MAEDTRKKRRRKPPFLLILILLIVVVAVALFLGRGLGLGQGTGTGDGGAADSPPVSDSPAPPDSPSPQESGGLELTVEVTRDQYLVDGEAVTLEDLEAMLEKADLDSSAVTVKDNYGSAKAHEELTALLARYGVSAVTE